MTDRRLLDHLYEALTAADLELLRGLLADDFELEVAAGMPLGLGGVHRGAEAAWSDVWSRIGRAFRVRPEPEEVIECADGRLLVRGRYVGRARRGGGELDAAFTHLIAIRDGRVASLTQLTDTALWHAALDEAGGG